MSAEKFDVDAESLRTGGDFSLSAAAKAAKAADVLAQVPLPLGMFGDFDEAHLFGIMVATARDEHVQQLRAGHAALTAIADRAHTAARASTDAHASEERVGRPQRREP